MLVQGITRDILLQLRFFLVAWINFSYSLIPFFFIRKIYLRIFGIKIGSKSYIHRGMRIFQNGNLTIGNNSVVNFNCYLDNRRGIVIGNNVNIANNTKIYTLGHNLEDPLFRSKGAPVVVEDNVFVFSNCLIMPGVTIREGAVVLAGSIVTKNVDAYTIVGGVPAKYVKDRIRQIDYITDYGYWYAL